MKFCPTCQNRYDEEILRFCTKDGTPLIEEKQPNFTALPSESFNDERDEETIVRRKNPVIAEPELPERTVSAPRIVIPTSEQTPREQEVRPRATNYQQPPPPKSNTAKVVLLTILGTLLVLAGAGGVFWMLQAEKNEPANTRTNVNLSTVNTDPPTNLNIGNSFNFNANISTNLNTNVNANLRTPTPTPTPRPSPTATPTPRPTPDQSNSLVNANSALPPTNSRPTPTPTAPIEPPVNRPVNAGVLNSRALNLPTPAYPSQARSLRIGGRVTVQVQVDETGNVASAKAVAGHPLLRQAAEAAARQSRFNPIRVNNQAVAATGVLVYNFVNQ